MNIILENPISVEEVYNNLKGLGNFKKMFNVNLNAEVSWYPGENLIEMLTILINDEIFPEIIRIDTYERFINNFPIDGWYYGYIND